MDERKLQTWFLTPFLVSVKDIGLEIFALIYGSSCRFVHEFLYNDHGPHSESRQERNLPRGETDRLFISELGVVTLLHVVSCLPKD